MTKITLIQGVPYSSEPLGQRFVNLGEVNFTPHDFTDVYDFALYMIFLFIWYERSRVPGPHIRSIFYFIPEIAMATPNVRPCKNIIWF